MMAINFLLQSLKLLHNGNYNETELKMIYEYLKNLDNIVLIEYFNTNSVIQYNNDLEFCIEIMDRMIKVLEEKEEYEKCQVLLNKKEESLDIIKIKIDEYEHI
jgi:hypothetical protein